MRGARDLKPTLGTIRIIHLVVSAIAPMASVIGIMPIAFAFGNGPGLPAAFVAVMIVLVLFSVGYSRMSRHVVDVGAFSAYVSRGLGDMAGLGAAFLALLSYAVFTAGVIGYLAFFAQTVAHDILAIDLPWLWPAGTAILLIAALGYRQIDISSTVLGLLLSVEIVILVLLNTGIWVHRGAEALPIDSLSWHAAWSGAPGIAIMLAFTCFIGFESAALYAEESQRPTTSIAYATYGSIGVAGLLYIATAWLTAGAIGPGAIQQAAASQLGNLFFSLSDRFIGASATKILELSIVTSMFSAALAFHNITTRYLFSLGRQRFLPAFLGKVHHRQASPYCASLGVSLVTLAIVGLCRAFYFDPLLGRGAVCIGLGTIGIIALQALTSIAVTAYFRGSRSRDRWSTLIAPLLSFIGLAAALVLAVANFDLLTGSQNAIVNKLPLLLGASFLLGLGYAAWRRLRRAPVDVP